MAVVKHMTVVNLREGMTVGYHQIAAGIAVAAAVVGGTVEGTAVGSWARRSRIARKMKAKPGKGSCSRGDRSHKGDLASGGGLALACCF